MMEQNYKSIKCYNTSMLKVDWIRNYMKGIGYHLNKAQAMDAALTQFTKMLQKMKENDAR